MFNSHTGLVSFLPVILKKKIFKYFQLFTQSEAMVAILNVEQDHSTHFKVHHIQVWSNLTKWFLKKKEKQANDRRQVIGQAHLNLWLK